MFWNQIKKNYDVCLIFFEELSILFDDLQADEKDLKETLDEWHITDNNLPVLTLPESTDDALESDCYVNSPNNDFGGFDFSSQDPSGRFSDV